MNADLLQQANFVLDSCGRLQSKTQSWVDIPAHIGYSRYMPGTSPGNEDIGGVMHKGHVPFIIRAVTAQALPRSSQGVYWRMRFPSGRFFQSEMSGHAAAFGFGSNRQSFSREVEWKPGEKIWIDLDTVLAGPPPSTGYTVSFMFEGVYRFPLSGPGAVRYPMNGGDLPRYFVGANQNILAPEFCFGPPCPSPTPQGFQDEEYMYVTPTGNFPITGSPISNIQKQMDPGSDFMVREVWPYFPPGLSGQGTGQVVVRMRRGDGYVLSSNFLPILSIQGPVFKELRIKAGDSFYYDAYVVNGAGSAGSVVTFGLILGGVKRRRVIS